MLFFVITKLLNRLDLAANVINKLIIRAEIGAMDDVSRRLKAVRSRLKLSQRALARKAGVPSSSVSLIESGKISPSVGVLKRLLDAVGVSLAEFFSFDVPQADAVFFRSDELMPIKRGGVDFRQVGGDLTHHKIQILHEVYAVGADTGRVMLSHDGEEGGIVLQGAVEVTVGDRSRVLRVGDAYLFDSRTPHRFRNVGEEPCILISACTPPTF